MENWSNYIPGSKSSTTTNLPHGSSPITWPDLPGVKIFSSLRPPPHSKGVGCGTCFLAICPLFFTCPASMCKTESGLHRIDRIKKKNKKKGKKYGGVGLCQNAGTGRRKTKKARDIMVLHPLCWSLEFPLSRV